MIGPALTFLGQSALAAANGLLSAWRLAYGDPLPSSNISQVQTGTPADLPSVNSLILGSSIRRLCAAPGPFSSWEGCHTALAIALISATRGLRSSRPVSRDILARPLTES